MSIDILKQLEWVDFEYADGCGVPMGHDIPYVSGMRCPICHGLKPKHKQSKYILSGGYKAGIGHSKDCELAKAIKAAK